MSKPFGPSERTDPAGARSALGAVSPVFSIITPTLDAGPRIEETLRSVAAQEAGLWEHVIVDGGSSDGTIDILRRWAQRYPERVRWRSGRDRGLYDAMNRGIEEARGEYLLFLGAGDRLTDGVLERVRPHLRHRCELVYGLCYFERQRRLVFGEFDRFRLAERNLPHQAVFYHRRVFDRVGSYSLDVPIFADYLMNLRCFADSTIEKRYIGETVAYYEQGGRSETGTDDPYARNLGEWIRTHLGPECHRHFKLSGAEAVSRMDFSERASWLLAGPPGSLSPVRARLNEKERRHPASVRVCDTVPLRGDDSRDADEILKRWEEHPDSELLLTHPHPPRMLEALEARGVSDARILVYQDPLFRHPFRRLAQSCSDPTPYAIFGAGNGGRAAHRWIAENNRNLELQWVFDNNPELWGREMCGAPVQEPTAPRLADPAVIVVASSWAVEIERQLRSLGVPPDRIVQVY